MEEDRDYALKSKQITKSDPLTQAQDSVRGIRRWVTTSFSRSSYVTPARIVKACLVFSALCCPCVVFRAVMVFACAHVSFSYRQMHSRSPSPWSSIPTMQNTFSTPWTFVHWKRLASITGPGWSSTAVEMAKALLFLWPSSSQIFFGTLSRSV